MAQNVTINNYQGASFSFNLVKEVEGPISRRVLWLAIWIVDNLFEESLPI